MKQADDILADVPRETEMRLRDYLALLIRWNTSINLVARAEPELLWQRHVLDSAQLSSLLPSERHDYIVSRLAKQTADKQRQAEKTQHITPCLDPASPGLPTFPPMKRLSSMRLL